MVLDDVADDDRVENRLEVLDRRGALEPEVLQSGEAAQDQVVAVFTNDMSFVEMRCMATAANFIAGMTSVVCLISIPQSYSASSPTTDRKSVV